MRLSILVMAVLLAGCGLREGRQAKFDSHRISQTVAEYEAATNPLGRCVAAKMTALAYDDAGAASDAEAWRAREKLDCQAAYSEVAEGAPASE